MVVSWDGFDTNLKKPLSKFSAPGRLQVQYYTLCKSCKIDPNDDMNELIKKRVSELSHGQSVIDDLVLKIEELQSQVEAIKSNMNKPPTPEATDKLLIVVKETIQSFYPDSEHEGHMILGSIAKKQVKPIPWMYQIVLNKRFEGAQPAAIWNIFVNELEGIEGTLEDDDEGILHQNIENFRYLLANGKNGRLTEDEQKIILHPDEGATA